MLKERANKIGGIDRRQKKSAETGFSKDILSTRETAAQAVRRALREDRDIPEAYEEIIRNLNDLSGGSDRKKYDAFMSVHKSLVFRGLRSFSEVPKMFMLDNLGPTKSNFMRTAEPKLIAESFLMKRDLFDDLENVIAVLEVLNLYLKMRR